MTRRKHPASETVLAATVLTTSSDQDFGNGLQVLTLLGIPNPVLPPTLTGTGGLLRSATSSEPERQHHWASGAQAKVVPVWFVWR